MDENDCVGFLSSIVEPRSLQSDGLETLEVAKEKYKIPKPVPINLVCRVCGEFVCDTQDWLLHHFTDFHRRIVQWVDAFRANCIEHQDEESESSFAEVISKVKETVQYTQELFEIQNRLFCCACVCDVDDIESHLRSLKHNEMVLSIVDSGAFVDIKMNCLKDVDGTVDEELYQQKILKRLSEELPTTADSPLEVVVLRNEEQFQSWFTQYRHCVNRLVELKGTIGRRILNTTYTVDSGSNHFGMEVTPVAASGENSAPSVVILDGGNRESPTVGHEIESATEGKEHEMQMIGQQSMSQELDNKQSISQALDNKEAILTPISEQTAAAVSAINSSIISPHSPWSSSDPNICKVCDAKYFSRYAYTQHCSSKDHNQRSKIHEFLNSDGKYVIGKEPATAQSMFNTSPETCVGLNDIYEMYDPPSGHRFWICGVCFCGSSSASNILGHIQGVKHKKRYIEYRYPDRKERISNKNEMSEWLNRVVNDIADVERQATVKHAMVLADIPDVLLGFGLKPSPRGSADNTAAVSSDMSNDGLNQSMDLKAPGSSKIEAQMENFGVTVPGSVTGTTAGAVNEAGTSGTRTEGTSEMIPGATSGSGAASGTSSDGIHWTIRCYRCTGEGHIRSECPKKPSVPPSTAKTSEEKKEVKTTNKEMSKAAPKPAVVSEQPIHIMEGPNKALICETCWEVMMVNDKEDTDIWKEHTASPGHRKAREMKWKWKFDPDNFISDGPSRKVLAALETAVRTPATVIVGLNEIIETRIASKSSIDVVCLMCSMKFVNEKYLAEHLSSKMHLMKFMGKNYPEAVATIFSGVKIQDFTKVIQFLVDRGARAGTIRVYDPQAKKGKSSAGSAKEQTKVGNETKSSSTGTVKKEKGNSRSKSKEKEERGKREDTSKGSKEKKPATTSKSETGKTTAPSQSRWDLPNSSSNVIAPSPGGSIPVTKTSDKMPSQNPSSTRQNGLEVLLSSPIEPIPIRYHAFAQPELDKCKEPCLGVDEVCEFGTVDPLYEPAYLCVPCEFYCNCNDLVNHLTSASHRLKFFEKKHSSIHRSLTAGASMAQKSILQSLAIKQHAQAIEWKEGRYRLGKRLIVNVDPAKYGMKKRIIAALTGSGGTPFTSTPIQFSSPNPFVNFGGGLVINNSGTSFQHPRHPSSTNDPLPPGVSHEEIMSTAKNSPRVVPPFTSNIPPPRGVGEKKQSTSMEEAAWNAKCDQFLANLSGSSSKKDNRPETKDGKKTSNGTDTKSSPTKKVPDKKTKDTTKKEDEKKAPEKKTKDTTTKKEDEKKSKTDSDSQRRRRPDRSRSRSRGHSRSRSTRSRSRSRLSKEKESKKSSGKSTSTSKSPQKGKTKDEKKKSPIKTEKDTGSKKRQSSSIESERKKQRVENAASSTKQTEVTDLLRKFVEQMTKKGSETAPLVQSKPDLGSLLERFMGGSGQAATVPKPPVPTTPKPENTLSSLLSSFLGKGETSKTTTTAKAKPAQSSMGEVEFLVKLLSEEDERQRRQEEQRKAIVAFLSTGTQPSTSSTQPSPMVIDYGHGSRASDESPKTVSQLFATAKSSPTSNDLVNEALRSLLKGQALGPGAFGQASTSTTSTPAVRPTLSPALVRFLASTSASVSSPAVTANAAPSFPRAMAPPPIPSVAASIRPPVFQLDMSRPPPPISGSVHPSMSAQSGHVQLAQSGLGQQTPQPNQAAAIVNAAAAMLLKQLFNQSGSRAN